MKSNIVPINEAHVALREVLNCDGLPKFTDDQAEFLLYALNTAPKPVGRMDGSELEDDYATGYECAVEMLALILRISKA